MDHDLETIAKLRRIQIGIYVLHVGLVAAGLVYFVHSQEYMLALAGGLFVYPIFMDLFGAGSIFRASIDDLQVRSIEHRNLRWLDCFMVGLFVILTIAEGIALIVYEPSQWPALGVMLPFFGTALLAPLIVFGWMFDRTSRRVLFTITRSGFKDLPPDSELWEDMQRDQNDHQKESLVATVFFVSIVLQALMIEIWISSFAAFLMGSIVITSFGKNALLKLKLQPIPLPAER